MFTSTVEGVNCAVIKCCDVRGGIDGAVYDTLGDVYYWLWHCRWFGKKWISELPNYALHILDPCTVWDNMVQYGRVWYSMVQYGTIWYSMVQYGRVWDNMVQYGRVWYSMVQYGRVW